MAKHGGATPLSIIDFVQTLHEAHDALCTLVGEFPVLVGGEGEARQQQQQQQEQQQQQQQQQQQRPPVVSKENMVEEHTEEAHADLSAAHKVHSLLMEEVTRKHALHHVASSELHAAQMNHQVRFFFFFFFFFFLVVVCCSTTW